ncbi:DUF1345 domain-containing protein [Kutzneria sp. NPDC052558]|uniref:DUF1345 domain-containing protein n=1 Tax=Kutzneria sp. NPDC052558 TaxID=3364121 RepID=UPI0037CC0760
MIFRIILLLDELALFIFGLFVFFSENETYLAIWVMLAFIYVLLGAWRVRHSAAGDDLMPVTAGLFARLGLLFTVFTSLVGVGAAFTIILGGTLEEKFIGVPAVLLAWAILHFGYAERYATAYYSALPVKQFEFPNTEQPGYADFAYFAFTVGTTFAVSDVETRTTAVRARVLSHGVLSFLYNTATLGVAISVITSAGGN